MSHIPHELGDEFPEFIDKIRRQRASDSNFSEIADRYESINLEILRIEEEEEAASDVRFEDLKKERLALKDQIFEILKDA